MYSLFPLVLSYGFTFAPLILRIALALTLGAAARTHIGAQDTRIRILGAVEIIVAVLALVGLWTQAAALVAIIICGVWFFFPLRTYVLSTVLLTFVIALSLIFLGAGKFAFDLPF